MPTSDADPRFPARFDDATFSEDLAVSTPPGVAAANTARADYERNGVPVSNLKPCEYEGRDATNLPDCAKVYVPYPDGKWGMVFKVIVNDGRPRLESVAFGVRHHPKGSHALTVYEIAHNRLHDTPHPEEPPPP